MSDYKRAKGVIPWKKGNEKPEDVIRRLRDGDPSNLIIQQFAKENNRLRELLERLYNASIGLLIIDDDDPDGTWLERMLEAKKVMDNVYKELEEKE